MFRLLSTLPKAVAVALGSLTIAGGAVGAAASAGTTEVPRPIEAVFEVLGFGSGETTSHRTATATASGTATPGPRRAKPTTTATPVAPSLPGLCRAYDSGSEQGRDHKRLGTAFVRLQNAAAAAGQDIATFCAGVLAQRRATPVASATAGARHGGLDKHLSSHRGESGTNAAKERDDSEQRGKPEKAKQPEKGARSDVMPSAISPVAIAPAGTSTPKPTPGSDLSTGKPDDESHGSSATGAENSRRGSSGSTSPERGNGRR